VFIAGLHLWYCAQTSWCQGNFRLQAVGVFVLFWWVLGGIIVYFAGSTEGDSPLSEQEPEVPCNRSSPRRGAERMIFDALRNHVYQGAVRLWALPATPEGLGQAATPPRLLEWALPELAEVGARLDALAEQLGESETVG
jgi:hypothetical protein